MELIMNDINKIIEKSNKENRIISNDEIYNVIYILLYHLNILDYCNNIYINYDSSKSSSTLGFYKYKDKSITINANEIIKIYKNNFIKINNELLYIILHEVRHVYQMKTLNDSTSINLSNKIMKSSLGSIKKEMADMDNNIFSKIKLFKLKRKLYDYSSLYDISPCERDANYFALDNSSSNSSYFNSMMLKPYVSSNNIEAPVINYLKGIFEKNIDKNLKGFTTWKDFPELFDIDPNDMDEYENDKMNKRIIKEISLEDRFKYGLTLTNEELETYKKTKKLR